MAERFKLVKYVTEKLAGYKKGQFVDTQKRGVSIVEDVLFERISDGWSFGLQSEYGWKCTAICRTSTENEKAVYAQQQAERTKAEQVQAQRKEAHEQLNILAEQAKQQGTQVSKEGIQGQTTRVQVKLDSYNNSYFLIGESAIWYVEMQDVYATIWCLSDDAQLREQLQQINEVLG